LTPGWEGGCRETKTIRVEQIVAILKHAEKGTPVSYLICNLGIAEQTFYRLKQRYAGLESEQVRELKQLQASSPVKTLPGDGTKLGSGPFGPTLT